MLFNTYSMIKITLLSIFCFSIIFFAQGQEVNRKYDSLIARLIERNMHYDVCDTCPQTGVCVIKVLKTDSIYVRLLYASSESFDLSQDRNLVQRLNKTGLNYIRENYSVIVPVYFYYNNQMPADELLTDVELKIIDWKLKRHKNVMKPIVYITYSVQRKSSVAMTKPASYTNDVGTH